MVPTMMTEAGPDFARDFGRARDVAFAFIFARPGTFFAGRVAARRAAFFAAMCTLS
jgi:hypothetical protein